MNPNKIDALQVVLNNKTIMSALKQVFYEATVDSMPKVSKEGLQADAIIGQQYRAHDTAVKIIDMAFDRMEALKKEEHKGNVISPR